MREPIPVTVLVGFLGSGKTTLLNRILSNADRRYAVIVNDFAELGIDAKLVRYRTEELVELSNGCICCTLRGDLLEELRTLSQHPSVDDILVESTGLGEPLPIAQTFYMDDLRERVRLDNIVTVLDASNFWRYYESELDDAASDEPIALAPLLVDQLEFCTTIVLNKVDLAHPDDVDALESLARQLNPSAADSAGNLRAGSDARTGSATTTPCCSVKRARISRWMFWSLPNCRWRRPPMARPKRRRSKGAL
jgi:G3E family GTPase